MTIDFSLSDIFAQAFGYTSDAFQPVFNKVTSGNALNSLRVEQSSVNTPYYANDALGREYFMPVTFTYAPTTAMADGTVITQPNVNYVLPYPVISVSSRKYIIETPLTERNGTVKELIRITDYEMRIRGLIIGTDATFPENDVKLLRTLYEQNAAIQIQSVLTDIFLLRPDRSGSDNVVIRELMLPEIRGIQNIRPYELLLVSDEPFNLNQIN